MNPRTWPPGPGARRRFADCGEAPGRPLLLRRCRQPRWLGLLAALALVTGLSAQIYRSPLPTGRGQITDLPARTQGQSHPRNQPRSPLIEKELRLAADYLNGRGVPKDLVQSAYWYRKAADQGDPDAQNQLGYFYSWGIGVPRDYGQAMKWFARAAGSGSVSARLNLAVMYLRGEGVAADPKLAVDMLTQLAEKGSVRAQDYLGLLFYSGVVVPRDPVAAEKWFTKAAKGKNPEGQFALGSLYSTAPDHRHDFGKAVDLLRRSARQGYVPAMQALAVFLLDHPEIRQKQPREDLSLLMRAAEAGSWRASAALGFLCRDGRILAQDSAEAFRWLTIAGRQGGAEADSLIRPDLLRLRDSLSSEQLDELTRRAEAWAGQHGRTSLFALNPSASFSFPADQIYAPE